MNKSRFEEFEIQFSEGSGSSRFSIFRFVLCSKSIFEPQIRLASRSAGHRSGWSDIPQAKKSS